MADAATFGQPNEERSVDTPPARKRPEDSEKATDPAARRRRLTPREKGAQSLDEEAAHLAREAASLLVQAHAVQKEATEAFQRARFLQETAAKLQVEAGKAKTVAEEAQSKAERAQLETTSEGRAQAKEQDKIAKKAAVEAAKFQKQTEKEEAATSRTAIKVMGDAIKDSMRIAKIGGMWAVPPGNLSFKNVSFSTFQTLFGRGRCAYTPTNFCPSDPTISVVTIDAGSVFGSTKIRGGSMYATFVISSMRATYIPAQRHLSIAYDTDMGF